MTGNISNHEDVLKVALAQYEATEKARTYSRSSTPIDEDAPLTITQLVDSTTDENGVTTETIAKTALLVLDGNERSVSALELSQCHLSGSGGNNTYSVYATHTMYAETRRGTPSNPSATEDYIRISHMTTVLTYGTAISAGSLLHRYADSNDYAEYDSIYEEAPMTYNPTAGTSYTYTPSSRRWLLQYNVLGSYIQTSVEVFVGNTSFSVWTNQPLDQVSWWRMVDGW